ncbi:hypothetical protein K678_07378 [Magnetospirillum fulvum MGU-K5]|uniref:Uncharacterized protein n=1 Tax=Magnetospirillum fulvum MGU-K5 TaxID=1316936 RepID=S9TIZ2_MAGFU|nr:hypothetical protein K678_07378 [Magnetospirillum fulvum MGU-K5]
MARRIMEFCGKQPDQVLYGVLGISGGVDASGAVNAVDINHQPALVHRAKSGAARGGVVQTAGRAIEAGRIEQNTAHNSRCRHLLDAAQQSSQLADVDNVTATNIAAAASNEVLHSAV